MRFSEIICEKYYNIKLSPNVRDSVDIHFTGAAHHRMRYSQANNKQSEAFHQNLFREHLASCLSLIYLKGDFSEAKDKDGLNLNNRENWNPTRRTLPDKEMFDGMPSNESYQVGENHPNDIYLNGGRTQECELINNTLVGIPTYH